VTELNANRWENSHRWPVFLPDGRHFLFFVRSFQPDISGIYVGSLDSRESHSVAKTAFGAVFSARGYLLYLRGETLVAQAFDERRLALTGEPLLLVDRVFLNPGTSSGLLSVSNGGVLVYYPAGKGGGTIEEYPRYSIWILPLTGERKPFPLVQSQFSNAAPVFSSDCQWVAYSSNESGRREVYVTHFPDAARRYQVSTEGGAVPQ
jgi:hypothetical protein